MDICLRCLSPILGQKMQPIFASNTIFGNKLFSIFYQCLDFQVPCALRPLKKPTRSMLIFDSISFFIITSIPFLHLRQHLLLHHHHHLHPHCQLSSQGKYECVATNTVGTEYSYSAQLYVRGSSYHYCYRHRCDYLCQSSLYSCLHHCHHHHHHHHNHHHRTSVSITASASNDYQL